MSQSFLSISERVHVLDPADDTWNRAKVDVVAAEDIEWDRE